jgi:hypothetical protein
MRDEAEGLTVRQKGGSRPMLWPACGHDDRVSGIAHPKNSGVPASLGEADEMRGWFPAMDVEMLA